MPSFAYSLLQQEGSSVGLACIWQFHHGNFIMVATLASGCDRYGLLHVPSCQRFGNLVTASATSATYVSHCQLG